MGANGKIKWRFDRWTQRACRLDGCEHAGPAVMSRTGWEHFPHDADVGVRGFGPTPAAAFEQGALALTAAVTVRVEPWLR